MAGSSMPPDNNIGPVLIWLTASLEIVAVLLTSLRIRVRYSYNRVGWDDWMILVALAIATSRMIFQILQSFYGNGRHAEYLSDEQYTLSVKWGWYAQLGLFAGVCFCKISICLLILRIKETKILKRVMWGVIAGLIVTNGAFEIILLAECSPVNAYWRGPTEACWDPRIRIYTVYVAVGFGVAVDLLLSLLPAYIVWHLQIPTRKKLLVSGLMALGLIASGFGIARAASLGIGFDDVTWDYAIVAIWSNLELWLAIIGANLALGRSIFLYLRGDLGKELNRTYGSSSNRCYNSNSGDGAAYNSNSHRSANTRSHKRSIFDMTLDAKMDAEESLTYMGAEDNAVWSECRRMSSTRSGTASEIPLEPQIQKSTDVHIHEDPRDMDRDVELPELDAARVRHRGYV